MMKVFVAGASGAIGSRLVPLLVAGGHEVAALTHSQRHVDALRSAGAEPVVADALDRSAVIEAVTRAAPDVIIHQLTALKAMKNFKKFDEEFALTNRLRTEGTDNLLAAARQAGARRFIAQSYGNWNYACSGTGLEKSEDDPLVVNPLERQRKSLAALCYLEDAVVGSDGIEGIALRYGNLYGPGTGFAADGDIVAMVRKRALPVVGDGAGVWSFIHVEDAASAAVAAIEHGQPGIYNVCDDAPTPVSVWIPELARVIGAKPPLRIPTWLARPLIGDVGISMMTQICGTSNAKARRELAWRPCFTSCREGFRKELAPALSR